MTPPPIGDASRHCITVGVVKPTCLVRLNMGAGLLGQLFRADRRDEGACRPSGVGATGSKRSRLSTGKPSYLINRKQVSSVTPIQTDGALQETVT